MEAPWVQAGLLVPGDTERLALLRWLADQGCTLQEMVDAQADDRLFALAGDRLVRPPGRRRTAAEAAEELGTDEAVLRRAWRALGLPDPVQATLGDDDVASLRTVLDVEALLGEATALGLLRVLGAGLGRLADAESSVMREVDGIDLAGTGSELVTAQAWQAVAGIVPRVGRLLDAAHRHHIDAARRHWETVLQDGQVRSGVGFADLSGFTALSQRTPLPELARLLAAFDETATEVVQGRGGRVVKFLGDAVMYVAAEPDAVVDIALQLVHHDRAREAGLAVRAGVAYGELVAQEGDWYGPPVNLAARLVAVAEPGQVVADAGLTARLSKAFTTSALPPRELRGVEGPVTAYDVSAPRGRAPAARP